MNEITDLSKVMFVVPATDLKQFFKEMEMNIITSFTKQIDKKVTQEDDVIMDVKGAAQFLGVTPQTVHNHKKDGKIPFHRSPAGKPYFMKSELLEAIKKVKF